MTSSRSEPRQFGQHEQAQEEGRLGQAGKRHFPRRAHALEREPVSSAAEAVKKRPSPSR